MAQSGYEAEAAAVAYLRRQGCKILERNWRTRWCEIDIIALHEGTAYLCEVKYRANTEQGYGLDYITPAKLRQMTFAANLWANQTDWQGEYSLCAIEVMGPSFRITKVIKELMP